MCCNYLIALFLSWLQSGFTVYEIREVRMSEWRQDVVCSSFPLSSASDIPTSPRKKKPNPSWQKKNYVRVWRSSSRGLVLPFSFLELRNLRKLIMNRDTGFVNRKPRLSWHTSDLYRIIFVILLLHSLRGCFCLFLKQNSRPSGWKATETMLKGDWSATSSKQVSTFNYPRTALKEATPSRAICVT